MKDYLDEWWKKGTTKERLIRSGADLTCGFLSPTKQFKHMQHRSHDNNKMIDEYLQFFNSLSSLPSHVTA
eukprot:5422088-Prorocentrum_lima.AAC.1